MPPKCVDFNKQVSKWAAQLSKRHPLFYIFAEPVSAVTYPLHPYLVPNPIDVKSMKSKSYESIEDVGSDFILMFDSALIFNGPPSAENVVFNAVTAMKIEFITYYISKLGYPPIARNDLLLSSPANPDPTLSIRIALHYDAVTSILSGMFEKYNKQMVPFVPPVSVIDAPDYYKIIQQPMFLMVVLSKLECGAYTYLYEFVNDVRQVWINAVTYYSNKDPSVASRADHLLRKFNKRVSTLLAELEGSKLAGPNNAVPEAQAKLEKPEVIVDSTPRIKLTISPVKSRDIKESSSKPSTDFDVNPNIPSIIQYSDSLSLRTRSASPIRRVNSKLTQKFLKIVDELMLDFRFHDFVNPVTEADAPGYFSIISDPMDLQTLHDNVTSGGYPTFREFMRDIELIRDNCMTYNTDSPIVTVSSLLVKVAVKYSQVLSLTVEHKSLNRRAMLDILRSFQNNKSATNFCFPFDPVALGYEGYDDAVSRRMDFQTLWGNVDAGLYDENPSELFRLDARLIFENAITYQSTQPPIRLQAQYLLNELDLILMEKLPTVEELVERAKRPDKMATAQSALKAAKAADFSKHFAAPVDPCVHGLLDYFDVISKPIDFLTIHRRLKIRFYNDEDHFVSDVLRVYDNCVAYHTERPTDWLCGVAEKLKNQFQSDWLKISSDISAKQKRGKDDAAKAAAAAKPLKPMTCAQLLSRLKREDTEGYFLYPVSVEANPTYLDVVSVPMDIVTVEEKLHSGGYSNIDDFAGDLRLVWSNCRAFNGIGSVVRIAGDKLGDSFERMYEASMQLRHGETISMLENSLDKINTKALRAKNQPVPRSRKSVTARAPREYAPPMYAASVSAELAQKSFQVPVSDSSYTFPPKSYYLNLHELNTLDVYLESRRTFGNEADLSAFGTVNSVVSETPCPTITHELLKQEGEAVVFRLSRMNRNRVQPTRKWHYIENEVDARQVKKWLRHELPLASQ